MKTTSCRLARRILLVPPLLTLCLMALSPSNGFAGSISFTDLNLIGVASLVDTGSVLRLTPNADTGTGYPPAGAAWFPTPVSVGSGFVTRFRFQLTGQNGYPDPDGGEPGADGFAFLIQNGPSGADAIGVGASGLGYMYIPNSLAVEFDTYENNNAGPYTAPYFEPDGNHIAINSRGTDPNMPHHACESGHFADAPWIPCAHSPTLGMTGAGGNPHLATQMTDGRVHEATISYNGSTLSMFLDNDPTGSLVIPLDLGGKLDLLNGQDAYIGFTAGERYSYQNHDILSWEFEPVPEPSSVLLLATGIGTFAAVRRRRRKQDAGQKKSIYSCRV